MLEELRDIDGLDAIGVWPLAIGWVVLIVLGACLLVALGWLLVRSFLFWRSWKGDALRKLKLLEKELSESNARECAIHLSEYLKRISVKRFSRKACAGLTGLSWLQWLKERDPSQFDWETKGVILIDAPYAPLTSHFPSNEVAEMIQAAKRWVV